MRLLKVSEASLMLGVSTAYLYRLVKANEIKAQRIGTRQIRFPEEELKKWLKKKQK